LTSANEAEAERHLSAPCAGPCAADADIAILFEKVDVAQAVDNPKETWVVVVNRKEFDQALKKLADPFTWCLFQMQRYTCPRFHARSGIGIK